MASYTTDIHSYYQALELNTPNNNQGHRVVIGDNNTFNFGEGVGSNTDYPFSIVADVYKNSSRNVIILSKATLAESNWSFVIMASGNILRCSLYSGAGNRQIRRETTIPIDISNKWVQIAFTYDGSLHTSGMNFYLNGEELTDHEDSFEGMYTGMRIGSSTPMIGVHGYGNSQYGSGSDGMVGSLSVWDKVLTLSEIKEINKGVITEDNLVTYYPMNEGLGDVIHDHSPNQIDGTIHGATWTDKVGFKV